jgi:predicted nucleic acid-binding protein
MWALFKAAIEDEATITVPTVVVAQVHRGNSPLVSRMLSACNIETLTLERARRAGSLLAASRTADIVDAVVVAGAAARRDGILTSDRPDIERLAAVAGADVSIVDV